MSVCGDDCVAVFLYVGKNLIICRNRCVASVKEPELNTRLLSLDRIANLVQEVNGVREAVGQQAYGQGAVEVRAQPVGRWRGQRLCTRVMELNASSGQYQWHSAAGKALTQVLVTHSEPIGAAPSNPVSIG